MAAPLSYDGIDRESPCQEKVVLWIDDDGLFLTVAEERLRSYGFCALVAQSGVMGLFLLTIAKVRAVIVDYDMPGLNGVQLAQQIKEMRPELPVFLYGGDYPEDLHDARLFEAVFSKANHCMEKLAQRLAAAIRRSNRPKPRAGPAVAIGHLIETIS